MLGNGKYLFLEAYKHKENNYSHDLYHNNHVIQKTKQKQNNNNNNNKTYIKFNPETLFYLHNFNRWEVTPIKENGVVHHSLL